MGFLDKLFRGKSPAGRISEEEGFLDIDLPIASVEPLASGEVRFIAKGEVQGQVIGFSVLLHSQWAHQLLEDSNVTLYWGTGAYERTGPESDRFVQLLAERYQIALPHSAMRPTIPVRIVGLASDPSDAQQSGAKMKFFLNDSENDGEESYAEVFTNIDVASGMLEFHEKDNGYRAPLVKALTEG